MRRLSVLLLSLGAAVALTACTAKTAGTTEVGANSAVLHATASCDKSQSCTWYWEYWPASQPRSSSTKTAVYGPVNGPTGSQALSEQISQLASDTTYRWVLCVSPNGGENYACTGSHGTFGTATADPPPDYDTFTTTALTPLVERWNGSSWTVQPTPSPSSPSSGLNSVSCSSPTACMAVGSYATTGDGNLTLAERRDGTTWTIVPTPNPAGSSDSVLTGVSCTSASACIAVGTNYTAGGGTALSVLVERWDGTAWTLQSAPEPNGTSPSLASISCTSATACTAVGTYQVSGKNYSGIEQTLGERWDGTSWTIQTTPDNVFAVVGGTSYPADTELSGVSCVSSTACTAVGSLSTMWNGTSWSGPGPETTPGGIGVSCSSVAACTSVKGDGASRWNGSTWTSQATANHASASVFLSAVSCATDTTCTAVGNQTGSGGNYAPLAEMWNGTSWTLQTTPNPNPDDDATLGGVSCTSATACTAVGFG